MTTNAATSASRFCRQSPAGAPAKSMAGQKKFSWRGDHLRALWTCTRCSLPRCIARSVLYSTTPELAATIRDPPRHLSEPAPTAGHQTAHLASTIRPTSRKLPTSCFLRGGNGSVATTKLVPIAHPSRPPGWAVHHAHHDDHSRGAVLRLQTAV